mgnify:CR=1 FL=1
MVIVSLFPAILIPVPSASVTAVLALILSGVFIETLTFWLNVKFLLLPAIATFVIKTPAGIGPPSIA